MTTISKEFSFSAGHMLPNHYGKCRRPHGHNYLVVVTVNGSTIATTPIDPRSDEGMLMDFGELKQIVQPVIDLLDHRFIVSGDEWFYTLYRFAKDQYDSGWIPPTEELSKALSSVSVVDDIPFASIGMRTTAENIAAYIFYQIYDRLKMHSNVYGAKVVVWETPTSYASHEGIVEHGQ